jgi:hypothetical protein
MVLLVVVIYYSEKVFHVSRLVDKVAPMSSFYPKVIVYYLYWYNRARNQNLELKRVLHHIFTHKQGYIFNEDHYSQTVKQIEDLKILSHRLYDKMPDPKTLKWISEHEKEFERHYSDLRANL